MGALQESVVALESSLLSLLGASSLAVHVHSGTTSLEYAWS